MTMREVHTILRLVGALCLLGGIVCSGPVLAEELRILTVEGTTSGVGNFMISHTLRDNPTMKRIAEEWLNYAISPAYQVNVIMGAYFPVNLAVKDQLDPDTVAYYHLDTPNYFQEQMILWPVLDKRTRTAFELFWNKAVR